MSSESRSTKNISPLSSYDDYEHKISSRYSKDDQTDGPTRTGKKTQSNSNKRLRYPSHETTSSSERQSFEKTSPDERSRLAEDDQNYTSEKRTKRSVKRKHRSDDYRSHSSHRHRNRFQKDERGHPKINHVPPESDPTSTKNLYVGNLDDSTTSSKLLEIFERYGIVETIDMKYSPYGVVYAFVTMTTLNMAYEAKTQLSGENIIGRSRCKIGYGRIVPTTAVWVGGLNTQYEKEDIKKLFDCFGKILKIEHRRGTDEAQIWYKSVKEATEAVNKMRGKLLPEAKKRFRTDFGDDNFSAYMKQRSSSSNDDGEFVLIYRQDLCNVLQQPAQWEGDFILKHLKHAVKLQLLESSRKNIDNNLLKDVYQLDITYKLKLEVPKLANIQKTISQSSSYQIFLGIPNMEDVTKQPLSELVRYLKEKSVAGFLHLSNKKGIVLGFFYIFPPCDIAVELIKRTHQISENEISEFLVCVSIFRS